MTVIQLKAMLEFVAKIFADLGKTVFTIGVASYFFENLPWYISLMFFIISILLLIIGTQLFMLKGEQQ